MSRFDFRYICCPMTSDSPEALKILSVSRRAETLDFACAIQQEGNQVKILGYREFQTTADAVNCIKENPNKDVIRVLKAYEKTWGDELESFRLQRKVTGVEVAVSAFFNRREFLTPINVSFEHKKLFPGEPGIYPLEFTSRFGYPRIQIQRAGITEPRDGCSTGLPPARISR